MNFAYYELSSALLISPSTNYSLPLSVLINSERAFEIHFGVLLSKAHVCFNSFHLKSTSATNEPQALTDVGVVFYRSVFVFSPFETVSSRRTVWLYLNTPVKSSTSFVNCVSTIAYNYSLLLLLLILIITFIKNKIVIQI